VAKRTVSAVIDVGPEKQDTQCTCNVTLWLIRVLVAVEKLQLFLCVLFYVLLTVHLSIILVINQLSAQIHVI